MSGDGEWSVGQKVVAGVVGAAAVGGIGYLAFSRLAAGPSDGQEDPEGGGQSGQKRTPSVMKEEGNTAFKAAQYRQAIDRYTEAIDSCHPSLAQERATYFQNRAAAYEKLGKDDEVIGDCSSAIEGNAHYVKAYSRRARAHERRMDYEAALKDFTAAAILENFKHYPTMEAADRVLKSLAQVKAKALYSEREASGHTVPLSPSFVESYLLSFCEDPVLNSLPKKGAAVANGGTGASPLAHLKSLLATKAYAEVTAEASRLLAEEREGLSAKERLEATVVRATFGLIQGALRKAQDDFEAAFELIDELPKEEADFAKAMKVNCLVKRGSFFMQQGLKDNCLEDFKAAEEADSENADIYHHRGQLLILMGEGQKAVEDFEKCISLRPDFELARVQGAFADYRAKAAQGPSLAETNSAILRFEELVKEFPKCSEGFALLGQIYTERMAYAEAAEMFGKALELAPGNANVIVHMGLLDLQRSEDVHAAKAKFLRALEVDAQCEFAYETLGTLEVQRGDVVAAIKHFDDALNMARTELELTHLISLKEAATAQVTIARQLNIPLPAPM